MNSDLALRQFVSLWTKIRLDRIITRGGQADPICSLCRTRQEKTLHMVAKCSYATTVWTMIASNGNFQLPPLQDVHRLYPWWELMLGAGNAQADHVQLLVYTAWNLWKERCRRVFDNKGMSPANLVAIIQQDIALYKQAHTQENIDRL
ncbi:hypothetical protein HU200_041216 [Digitaria exilis]|uniref:Reverse transcriptase zinc-binding domain-containing protein n=1 Tax=Digitaria exilis TaxID=1010633 RepID=A0A835B8U3_9POAL|nr:hypothetical protein HU200_041216 [Digitaria exilis]